jgi:hypothetical protein
MAKPSSPAAAILDGLTWEQQYQQLPEFPTRPMLFDSDMPKGELATMAQAKFQTERDERVYQLRMALSGHNAQPYVSCGAQAPAERDHERKLEQDARRYQNGLPDSPTDMPPKIGSGKPY